MYDAGRHQGNSNAEVLIFSDAVYVHNNIVKIEDGLYEYDEYVFTPQEYNNYLLEMNLPKVSAKARADIDYIAMETGVDIDE